MWEKSCKSLSVRKINTRRFCDLILFFLHEFVGVVKPILREFISCEKNKSYKSLSRGKSMNNEDDKDDDDENSIEIKRQQR